MMEGLGMSREDLAVIRERVAERGLPDPYRNYCLHRNNAKLRGVRWEFTFATWWAIWEEYYHMRGRGTNDLCMAREKDEGPYAPWNVYLTTHLGNARDYRSKSSKAIQRRQEVKERKEMEFARQGTTSKAESLSAMSHNGYKARHGPKSTCNYSDLDLAC